MLLVIGNGNLGRSLARIYKGKDLTVWDKDELDITDYGRVTECLTKLAPAVVINAAAFTDTAAAEKSREAAYAVNATAVGTLASVARAIGAAFVHISTDYVFHGDNPAGYKETDIPANPLNYYGASKLEGERLMLAAYGLNHKTWNLKRETWNVKRETLKAPWYLIRTSWLFSKTGKSFPATMLKLAETKPELEVVRDQHGKPTYAPDLAAAILALVAEGAPAGVYHLTNEPAMSWYDFARLVFETKKTIDPKFKAPLVKPIPAGKFPSPVKRPEFSILLNTKRPALRHIREALMEYLK